MNVPGEIQAWYSQNRNRLALVETKVRAAMDRFASSNGYLYGGRIKTIESITEKVDTGRVRSWNELDDAYAGTVVIPTYSHEPAVRQFLCTAFREERVMVRGSKQKPAENFRFDSTRVYCRIRSEDEKSELAKIAFEIHIQSAFDYAWQKVTHDLVYKNKAVDWRRARLAAQMKAAVEQLDLISEHFDEFVSTVFPSCWPETDVSNRIIEYVDRLFINGRLPAELSPVASSRLAESVISFLRSDNCRASEMEARVDRALDAIDGYLNATAPNDIPRSLTLAQLFFGVLYRAGVISKAVRQRILLNDPMKSAFPELRAYGYTFDVNCA